jgi:hypothetical protein
MQVVFPQMQNSLLSELSPAQSLTSPAASATLPTLRERIATIKKAYKFVCAKISTVTTEIENVERMPASCQDISPPRHFA